MKLTQDMINRVKEIAEDPSQEYQYIGIRVQEETFTLGEIGHRSHIWIDGDDTGEELNGLCVLSAKWVGRGGLYYGSHAAIIGGNRAEYGEDVGELVIEDPIVLEIIA